MELITGLHTHFNKDAGFEYRIIEVDGSSTVAFNPISLYLVVTNNSSGDNLQSRMVTLPRVSAIKRVRFTDERSIIHVDVMLERQNDDGTQTFTRPATIVIAVPVKEGRLPKVIDVVVDQPKAEPAGADQPATKPADKVPVIGQPSTPTSKDAPR